MAERPHVNFVRIAAEIGREQPKDEDAAACEAGVDTLCFLDERSAELGAEPGPAARLAILDLCAALVGFGGVRDTDELVQWLRKEVPGRAQELTRAVSASPSGSFDDLLPSSCLSGPEPASWH
jgi:hypothetical protein